jgi:hypothetical protein
MKVQMSLAGLHTACDHAAAFTVHTGCIGTEMFGATSVSMLIMSHFPCGGNDSTANPAAATAAAAPPTASGAAGPAENAPDSAVGAAVVVAAAAAAAAAGALLICAAYGRKFRLMRSLGGYMAHGVAARWAYE